MNRMVLTKLLKNLIDLYVEDKFTCIYIVNAIDNLKEEEFDEDENAYAQAELIATLFSLFPYYRLLYDLNELGDYIIESTKNNLNSKSISKLLKNGCLGDMVPDIKRRVQTETMAHVMELIYLYKTSELSPENVIAHLTKNMYNPQVLTSMDYAEGFKYQQEEIPGIEIKKLSLRETISRANSNRKEAIRRNLEEYTIENFNEKELEEFTAKVIEIIDQSQLPDKDILKSTVYDCLISLFSKAVLTWDAKEETSFQEKNFYQLSLEFK